MTILSSWTTLLALVLVALSGSACELRPPTAPTTDGAATLGSLLSYCADEVNRYRVSAGKPPLTRLVSLEAFASEAAQADALAHVAHHYFNVTKGNGMAMAETEILWWRGFAVRAVIERGLAQMWQVGPSGEHYDIIVGPYSEIGCGVFVNGSEVTVTQDFR